MRQPWLVVGIGVAGMLVAGCATAIRLPQGPHVYSLPMTPGAASIIVAHPVDERSDRQRLGTISALGVVLKEEPSDLVAREVVMALHTQGINATLGHLSSHQPEAFAGIAQQSSADGILALSLQSLSVSSFDALLDPPTATVTLRATLYDSQGAIAETTSVTGQVQRRVNTFAAERAIGELVGEAVHDAAQRLVRQGSLTDAVARLTAAAHAIPDAGEAPPAEAVAPEDDAGISGAENTMQMEPWEAP